MRQLVSTLHRAFWLAWIVLSASATLAAAAPQSLADADLDGDGRVDLVTVESGPPFVLHIWLSSTATTQTVRSRTAVAQVVATDIDGDHRPEIVARGEGFRLHVWRRSWRGFHAVHPRRSSPAAFRHGNPHQFDDGPSSSGSAVPGFRIGSPSLTSAIEPPIPPLRSAAWQQRRSRAPDSQARHWNAGPRPPPTALPFSV